MDHFGRSHRPAPTCGDPQRSTAERTLNPAGATRKDRLDPRDWRTQWGPVNYQGHEQLKRHLDLFLNADNHARRLKTLKGLTPAQFIWKEWQPKPELFYEEPCQLDRGTKHLVCLDPAMDAPSPIPARTGDGVGYSAKHLVA